MPSPTAALPTRIELAEGLVGLPSARSFELRPVPSGGIVELVSLDDPELGFVAAPADAVRAGYTSELVAAGFAGPDGAVLVLLAIHGDPPAVTANLAGPLVVAPDGSSRQLVLEGTQFPLHQPLGTDG
jgi:flagellar assembly factor FliW